MTTSTEYSHRADLLVKQVRDLLDSDDPKTRVRAVQALTRGCEALERRVVSDAQESGLSWAAIGDVYGVTRQAVHRRFADSSYIMSERFDELLDELDAEPEVIDALQHAADRVRGES